MKCNCTIVVLQYKCKNKANNVFFLVSDYFGLTKLLLYYSIKILPLSNSRSSVIVGRSSAKAARLIPQSRLLTRCCERWRKTTFSPQSEVGSGEFISDCSRGVCLFRDCLFLGCKIYDQAFQDYVSRASSVAVSLLFKSFFQNREFGSDSCAVS